MKTEISKFEQQALDFLNLTGAELEIVFSHSGKYFDGDKEDRDIYNITLIRGSRKYQFKFGQSTINSGFYYTKGRQKIQLHRSLLSSKNIASTIRKTDCDFLNNGKSDTIHYPVAPTPYDILSCLTKNDPDTFENFCLEFGYDEDSKKADKVYRSVLEEWYGVTRLFTDEEVDQLQEIN